MEEGVNCFLKLHTDEGKPTLINVNNITHIKEDENSFGSKIYVVGKEYPVKVTETINEVESMLPRAIELKEINL